MFGNGEALHLKSHGFMLLRIRTLSEQIKQENPVADCLSYNIEEIVSDVRKAMAVYNDLYSYINNNTLHHS